MGSGLDANRGADVHLLEQGEHILWREADAAVGGRGAEAFCLVCAVNVDVAGAGVGVVRLQPVESQNAGQNRILAACGLWVQADRDASAEHRQERGVFAVHGAYFKSPQRRAAGAGLRAHTGLAGGAIEAQLTQPQFLLADGYGNHRSCNKAAVALLFYAGHCRTIILVNI